MRPALRFLRCAVTKKHSSENFFFGVGTDRRAFGHPPLAMHDQTVCAPQNPQGFFAPVVGGVSPSGRKYARNLSLFLKVKNSLNMQAILGFDVIEAQNGPMTCAVNQADTPAGPLPRKRYLFAIGQGSPAGFYHRLRYRSSRLLTATIPKFRACSGRNGAMKSIDTMGAHPISFG